MIEVKNNNLIIDEKKYSINEINMIQSVNGKLYFSNNIVEISKNPYDINELHKKLTDAGFSNFELFNNSVVNVENIDSMYIKYFQFAGISIFQCDKKHAEMFMLVMNCKNGKAETISFRTAKEAEKCYHILDNAIIDFKNNNFNNLK